MKVFTFKRVVVCAFVGTLFNPLGVAYATSSSSVPVRESHPSISFTATTLQFANCDDPARVLRDVLVPGNGCSEIPRESPGGLNRLLLLLTAGVLALLSTSVGIVLLKSRKHKDGAIDQITKEINFEDPNSLSRAEPSPTLGVFLKTHSGPDTKFSKAANSIHEDGVFSGLFGGRPFSYQLIDSGGIWHLETGDGLYGALWSEKIAGQGEDAVPLLVVGRREGVVVGGVFDGLGGSGASRIDWDNGISVSHAWEAARICRYSLEHFLASMRSLKELVSIEASSFSGLLLSRLQNRSGELHQVQSGLSSSLARILPTTLAGFTIQMKGTPSVEAFWAGDSRTYLLDPQRGLQVLTIDDAAEMDAFESLNVDPPLSNVICADRPFVINSRTITPSSGFLVVAATDGCFNYWPTPANFEFEILEAIMNSATWESALDALNASIRSITKDDASLSLAAIGFKNFKALQSSLAQRHLELRELTYLPLAELKSSGGSREAFEEYRVSTWQAYKASYEMLLDVPS